MIRTAVSVVLFALVVWATVNAPALIRSVDSDRLRDTVATWTEELGDATADLVGGLAPDELDLPSSEPAQP